MFFKLLYEKWQLFSTKKLAFVLKNRHIIAALKLENATDMKNDRLKQIVLLLGLMLPTAWCGANAAHFTFTDGYSHIAVKENHVQNVPKGSTIQASIYGHLLTVVFTENIGQVEMEINKATGELVQTLWVFSPDGLQTYIPQTGGYIITFKLSNGDEYYGEFTVTD